MDFKRIHLVLLLMVLMLYVASTYTGKPEEDVYRKLYVYPSKTVTRDINNDIEVRLNIVELDCDDFIWGCMSRSWWSYFNVSLVNKSDKLCIIHLEDNYYDVEIQRDGETLYRISQGFTEVNETQTVYLIPRGYISNDRWTGAQEYIDYTGELPYGSYDIVGVFQYNSNRYLLEGLTLDIVKEGPITRPG